MHARKSSPSARQQVLRRLVAQGAARTQWEIRRAFARQGIRVTQSSISRDIARLGLVKVRGVYALPTAANGRPLPPLLAIEPAGRSLLVLKTLPGMAAAIAVAIDEHRLAQVVGTVAGDDTVFVATAAGARQARVATALRGIFPARQTP